MTPWIIASMQPSLAVVASDGVLLRGDAFGTTTLLPKLRSPKRPNYFTQTGISRVNRCERWPTLVAGTASR
jgi:hypothetical protein